MEGPSSLLLSGPLGVLAQLSPQRQHCRSIPVAAPQHPHHCAAHGTLAPQHVQHTMPRTVHHPWVRPSLSGTTHHTDTHSTASSAQCSPQSKPQSTNGTSTSESRFTAQRRNQLAGMAQAIQHNSSCSLGAATLSTQSVVDQSANLNEQDEVLYDYGWAWATGYAITKSWFDT